FHTLRDCGLTCFHSPFEVASIDRKLDPDVPGIILPVDKRSSGALADRGQFRKRNLLACWRRHKQIADFPGVRAKLWLHTKDEIEQLLTLDDLRSRLASDPGLHHGFDIGDVDSVTRNLLAVGIDQ